MLLKSAFRFGSSEEKSGCHRIGQNGSGSHEQYATATGDRVQWMWWFDSAWNTQSAERWEHLCSAVRSHARERRRVESAEKPLERARYWKVLSASEREPPHECLWFTLLCTWHALYSKQTNHSRCWALSWALPVTSASSRAPRSLTAYPRFALHRSLYRARSCISTHTLRLPSSTRAPNVTQLPHTQQTQSAYYIATCFHINGHWTSHRFSVCITALFVSHRSPFFQFLLNCNTTLVYWLL